MGPFKLTRKRSSNLCNTITSNDFETSYFSSFYIPNKYKKISDLYINLTFIQIIFSKYVTNLKTIRYPRGA